MTHRRIKPRPFLFLVIITALASLATGTAQADTGTITVVDLAGKRADEKLAAYALQGLANRNGPHVFVRLKGDNRWTSFRYDNGQNPVWSPATPQDFKTKYPYTEDYWLEWLTRRGYALKDATWQDLAADLARQGVLKRAIIYEHQDEDMAIVTTGAGVDDAVPLTPALQSDPVIQGLNLPVAIDVRAVRKNYPTGANPKLAAHAWMIDNLLAKCATDGAVSRVKLYNLAQHDTIVDVDHAVQHRWAVLDLNYTAMANKLGDKVDPPDLPLIDKILGHLDRYSAVWGWGYPGESEFIRSCTRHYLVGICSGVGNNSFFSALPEPARQFRQATQMTPDKVKVEDKIYVAFAVNEGDTIKNLIALMGDGGWIQPERGTLPINWGIDPLLVKEYPALMAYIYDTATPNDYFFAATSGWGYTHPAVLPPDAIEPYAALVKKGMADADVRYLDLWWPMKPDALEKFIRGTGAVGWMNWTKCEQGVSWDGAGVMRVKSNLYYTMKNPTEFAERLKSDSAMMKAPWFIYVYGGDPYKFSQVARQLPTDKFKVVRLDEFFSAAKKARAQIEGRAWIAKPNAPKGVAP